jgi:PAS domain S-box-containing protein
LSKGKLRRELRFECTGLVDVFACESGQLRACGSGLLSDISESGACIQMDAGLPPGTDILFKNRSVEVRALVRNVSGDGTVFKVGVEFTHGFKWKPSSVPVLPDAAIKVERGAEVAAPERASAPSRAFRTIKEALRQIALAHQRIVLPRCPVQSSANTEVEEPSWHRTFEELPCPAIVLNPAGQLLYANSDFGSAVGSALRRVHELTSFVYYDDLALVGDTVLQVCSEPGSTKSIDFRIANSFGRVRLFRSRWRYSAGYDSITVLLEDITEEQDEVAELRARIEFLSSIGSPSPMAAWEWDVDGDVVTCSDECVRLYGLEPHTTTVPFSQWLGLIHPDDRQETGKALLEAGSSTASLNREMRIIRPDGQVVFIAWRGSVRSTGRDGATRVTGASVDVTEQRRAAERAAAAAEQLSREKRVFAATLEQFPAGICVADAATGDLISCNTQLHKIWRKQIPAGKARYHDMNGYRRDGHEYVAAEWPLIRSLRKGETVAGEEVMIRRGDGTYGTIRINSAPVRELSGKIIASVATVVDTTESSVDRQLAFAPEQAPV